MLKAMDISENNPNPDLAAEKARGLNLVVIKLSQGTGYTSHSAKAQWDEAGTLALLRGVYHFATPNLSTPIVEANYFLSACQEQGIVFAPYDLIFLDFERAGSLGAASPADWALTWLETVGSAVGAAPGFPGYYCDYSFATGVLDDARLNAYEWWAAAWTKSADIPSDDWPTQAQAPAPPGGRSPYFLWQWSASGFTNFPSAVIPGHGVDLDLSFLTRDQFTAQYGKRPHEPQYKVIVEQWLREKPQKDSSRLIDVPVNAIVTNYGAPTPNWYLVIYNGVQGWIMRDHVAPA
jgi:GH25 family lysozyme M1 (1,4-beta-N-acetylmuramidase)